jgi:hypothetical protein
MIESRKYGEKFENVLDVLYPDVEQQYCIYTQMKSRTCLAW